MVYLDNLKYMKLYKKSFYLPIDKKNKKKGSAILLLTPNYEYSNKLMNHKLAVNNYKSYISYYIEKDIMYTINNETNNLEIAHYDHTNIINEQPSVFIESTDIKNYDNEDLMMNEFYCKMGDKIIFFNELYDEEVYNEVAGLNTKYKQLLYNDRLRNNKEVILLYDKVKEDNDWIKKTYVSYNRYKKLNLFIDLSYYNQVYLGNNRFTINKSIDMYFEFIRRFINDKRIDKAGYTKKTVFVPVDGWVNDSIEADVYDFYKVLNPISVFYKKIKLSVEELDAFDLDFIFFGENGYFKMNPSKLQKQDHVKFIKFIKALRNKEAIIDDESNNSADAIATDIINKIEHNNGIKLHNLTGEVDKNSDDKQEKLKAELVSNINKASKESSDEEEAINKLEDDNIKKILKELQENSDDGVKLSATRINRINKNNEVLLDKKFKNTTVKEMITTYNRPEELPEKALPIKSINDEWKHLKTINFEKRYDLDADILRCLHSLSDTSKEFPVSILNIDTEDTSTSEDSKYTYIVKCEDFEGKRFTLKFDIPKFRENRFMRLRGNEKVFSGELPLLPISKTNDDVVQIATLYKKLTISRYNTSSGKSSPETDKLMKALDKYDGKKVKIINGDNSKICAKYDLPIDYIDLASKYSKIIYYSDYLADTVTIYFNQDEIRQLKNVDPSKGIPIAVSNKGEVMYYTDADLSLASKISSIIEDKEFRDIYDKTKPGKKFTYSRAKILNTFIPIIVILAHNLGLTKAMDMANIEYNISDKKSNNRDNIKFADGYINYTPTYSALMLMNGLKDCGLEDVNISAINSKNTWVNVLDNFGGRIKSDGLDNFKDLMYDPITVEVSRDYKLPDNYFDALIYASDLLIDNKYIKHSDLSSNRYRTCEVVAAHFYQVLSDSYHDYALQNKRGRSAKMFIKQSAVIDSILTSPTTSDLSVFQPLLELETKGAVSTKGVSGMNKERAYNIDKRGYDDSMVNVIAQATGFANTVGINRQMTINAAITGGRGYIKSTDIKDANVTNTMSITEALSPYTVTSDDLFRNFMTFTQTAKHSTPIEYGTPLLVTTGADMAMPYLVSDMFCHKAKKKGVVKEITDKYMIVQYDDETTEFVNLSEQTMKNSDGGFYISLKLITDLKVGDRVKQDTVLAYDSKSFSNRIGNGKNIGYNLGCLTKVAIMTTDDGFEDSGVCSDWLSNAMASDIVVCKDINLPASTNVLYIAKVGQAIKEGDPILIFQNVYDEEDANIILKTLNAEEENDIISEIGHQTVKAKVTGVISDIKIYRTVEKDELSESLRKIVNKKESEINSMKKLSDKASNNTQFDSTEKLEPTGKLKHVDGVKIEIYMKYHDKLAPGDKLTTNANKVVLMSVYDNDNAPYTDFRKDDKIDLVTSCSALDGRMITSPIKGGAINKLMVELHRKVCDVMGVKWKNIHEIYYSDVYRESDSH